MSDRVKILGYGVDTYTFDNAVENISNAHGQVVTINPEMIINAQKDTNFSKIIEEAEFVIPDGIGVEIGLKILGHNVKRIAGIELGKELIIKFSNENKSIAFIGGKPNIADLAIENIKKELPCINVAYTHDGYFDDEDEIIIKLASLQPDLVLVALGSPKQEFFINKLKDKLPSAVMIGLGGSFDVWAGVVKRAPKFYQRVGLEWLYRTITEPKRFNRIFPTLPKFILNVMKERISK